MKKERNNKFVYIVTKGKYSDYHICGVFSNRKRAKFFADHIEDAKIEKWELDSDVDILKHKQLYFVRMNKNGDTIEVGDISKDEFEVEYWNAMRDESDFDINGNLFTTVFAKDEQEAVKIVNEKRIQLIANGIWKRGENEKKDKIS